MAQNKLWQILYIIYPFSHMSIQIMYQSIQNYPPRPAPGHTPGIWLEFCSIQWGIWPKMCCPAPQVRHLTFKPTHWSVSQAKGFFVFWLCLVEYLHLNKQFDAWENFWIVGELGFDTFRRTSWWGMRIWLSKLPKYQGISPKFLQKSQMPGGCWCHGQF